MRILHISVAGIVDKFYLPFLLKVKSVLDAEQTIYIPYKEGDCTKKELEIIDCYKEANIQPIVLPIKNRSDRILYYKKIRKYLKKLEERISIKEFHIIHAHSLYSDGGVAYLINRKYGIPYIVAVRATDIVVFMKYFRHLDNLGRNIIKHASKVIFITPSLKYATLKALYKNNGTILENGHSTIIPNGINEYWIRNIRKNAKQLEDNKKIKLIQISRLKEQKNVDKTIKAVDILRKKGLDITLDIVGEGKERENLESLTYSLGLINHIKFHGYITDLNKLQELFSKNNIFVLPSSGETFGLTYIEAMSQGLPIIGIKKTGVSDFFHNGMVGYFIDYPDPMQIASAV